MSANFQSETPTDRAAARSVDETGYSDALPLAQARRARIAYVVHTFDMGGAERCVARLLNGLDRRRYIPSLICLQRSGTAEGWIHSGDVEIFALNKGLGNDPRVVPRLARLLHTLGTDIVHSTNWGTLVETSLARRWAGVRAHVHAERGLQYEWRRKTAVRQVARRWLAGWAFRSVDQLVVPAHTIRDDLMRRYGQKAGRVEVIPNGVDAPVQPAVDRDRFRVRGSLDIADNALVIGSVGRLVAVKDFRTAIRATAELRTANVDVHLILVGDGPERHQLLQLGHELKIGRHVHFLGRRDDVTACVTAMDVYVNTSLSEGMSQGILEAMAVGLPLVVTDVGDNARIAASDPCCGTVIPPGNYLALAHAVLSLTDSSLHSLYRENARRKYARDYTASAMQARYQELYVRVADRWLMSSMQSDGRREPSAPLVGRQ